MYLTEHIQTEVSIVYSKGTTNMNQRHGRNDGQKCLEGLQSQLIRPNYHGLWIFNIIIRRTSDALAFGAHFGTRGAW
jgi:hypothetical protein